MKRFVVLEKKVGETPLAALEAWKRAHPEYTNMSASYAGRLDPMASGKLLILLGEECKKQAHYTGLDKEYEVEILLDIGSDTGDALGLVTPFEKETAIPARRRLAGILRGEEGKHVRAYPQFSSKTVNGKPLFLHTLEGNIHTIDIPTHEERIYHIQYRGSTLTSERALRARIDTFLEKVPTSNEPSKVLGADFRINAVRSSWQKILPFASASGGQQEKHSHILENLRMLHERNFVILKLKVVCGTGAYMRSLAGRLGEALGTKGLALSIHRTKIGTYWNGLWLRQF